MTPFQKKKKKRIIRGILGVLVKISLNLILFTPISPNFKINENLRLSRKERYEYSFLPFSFSPI